MCGTEREGVSLFKYHCLGNNVWKAVLRFALCHYYLNAPAYYKTLVSKVLNKIPIANKSFPQKWLWPSPAFFFFTLMLPRVFVLIWLSSCQPPYGNLPTLTISIFVVLIGTIILKEEVIGAGMRTGNITGQPVAVACEGRCRQHAAAITKQISEHRLVEHWLMGMCWTIFGYQNIF